MNTLPTAIEEALKDAGFTQTEILIMRRLIEEQSLPLRQLAAKTGKSTGVLDQAMKKLMKKGIVSKEMINDSPVYTFVSLEAVMQAIEEDTEHKREMLKRRYENFEAFVNSLAFDKQRPEIESFQGDEGLKRAYCKLLESGRELLVYQPTHDEEEDPALADFRVEYFRERRRRNIYSRVIAHNTPLGRKFQGRDAFEFRKTFLVDPAECAFTFEKLIIGSAVACFNHAEKRACIIRYPELAQTERTLFEALWNEKTSAAIKEPVTGETVTPPTAIPWKVRTLSQLRNFFISPQSLAVFAVFAVIAGAITFGLYRQNVYLNTQRVRERVKAIAATAAPQFDWRDLEELHTIDDITKPEYAKVIYQLNEVRRQNEGVKYAYVLRPTDQPLQFEFIADADSIDPFFQFDYNADGVIDEADENIAPGRPYDVSDIQVLREGTYSIPNANDSVYSDQWGTWMTGYGPIKDDDGNIRAILAFDINAEEIHDLAVTWNGLVMTFFGIFLFFVVVRLAAFNRSLASELCIMLRKRNTAIPLIACLLLALMATGVLAWHNNSVNKQRLREKAESIARTGALQFSADDLNELQIQDDWRKPEWAKVVKQLEEIRLQNDGIFFAYIFRKKPQDSTALEFVADSHSLNPFVNTDDDPMNDIDVNHNGKIDLDGADLLQWPGQPYPAPHDEIWDAFYNPIATKNFYTDQWGTFITGYAPIKNKTGATVAVIGVDIGTKELRMMNAQTFFPLVVFGALFLILLLARMSFLHESLLKRTVRLICGRKTVIAAAAGFQVAFWVFFGWQWHEQRRMQKETGKRLMAIAATAATQFDSHDLDLLRKAGDMRTETYQRVFQKLLEIRKQNPGVRYVYILRPTEQEHVYEFVADADSNYYIPFLQDQNQDGVLDEVDEGVAPGVRYFAPKGFQELYTRGLTQPATLGRIETDQWGSFLSGVAPIKNASSTVGFIQVDISLSTFDLVDSWLITIAIVCLITIAALLFVIKEKETIYRMKKIPKDY